VEEVDVDPVDGGRELGQRVQLGLGLAPVVLGRPVAGERLHRRQLHPLGAVGDQLSGGPARRGDAAAKVVQCLLGDVDPEGANLVGGLDGATHDDLRWWWWRRSTQGPECGSDLGGGELRLLPGREVVALGDFVE
jgi:hypothetical protein